jgi:signal transduction histidine kinase
MDLGYELVKEQLFFRKELIERVSWFIRLRWIAVGAACAGGAIGYFAGAKLPYVPIGTICLCIIGYNFVFYFIWRHLQSTQPQAVQSFTIFAHTQIAIDLLALFAIFYFTGGIHSPFFIFVLFHIILAGILLPPLSCFVYAILVILATAVLFGLQNASILPPQPGLFDSHLFPRDLGLQETWMAFAILAATLLITAFLITTIKLSLRAKGRELLRVSKELDAGNAKLRALYQMVKEMGSCDELKELMDSATRNAATIMGVKACSIKLLDDHRQRLTFSSTYGLSQDYLSRGSIDLDKSPINRQIIEGFTHAVARINEKDYFQYPEDIRKEGIASMLCLPLRVEKMVLGVFCVYSDGVAGFAEEDIRFFALMADLTALAIENLRSELNKAWFLEKTAHQLRSPLYAIDTMLKTLRRGYLRSDPAAQEKMLGRCEQRIANLSELINDLLDLGLKRMDLSKTTMQPVNVKDLLQTVVNLYQPKAAAKQLDLSYSLPETVPPVMAEAKMIDELINNLISNAIKYTPAGGRVLVRLVSESSNRLRLEVADTGIGIPDEEIPRLFTEFFRAENAKTHTEEGTGLGLVIVKEILDRLRGTVSVTSKLGEGTCITCFLPAIPPSE